MIKPKQFFSIDELTICYKAPKSELAYLKENLTRFNMWDCLLVPQQDKDFDYCFKVVQYENSYDAGWVLGFIKFGDTFDEYNDYYHVFFYIANSALYGSSLKDIILIPFYMCPGMAFNNYTSIDIAFDSPINTTSLLRKKMLDRDIQTIINNKKVENRKKALEEAMMEFSVSLEKLIFPTLTIKQQKAKKNKHKGIVVQAYNKLAEVKNKSKKDYILKKYHYPRTLHRLEVRIDSWSIKKHLKTLGIKPELDLIFSEENIKELFFQTLASTIRFSDKRGRKIKWKELLKC